jgi:hypothetical protein
MIKRLSMVLRAACAARRPWSIAWSAITPIDQRRAMDGLPAR